MSDKVIYAEFRPARNGERVSKAADPRQGKPYTVIEIRHEPEAGLEFSLIGDIEEGRVFDSYPGGLADTFLEVHISPGASADDVMTALRVVMADVARWPTEPPF